MQFYLSQPLWRHLHVYRSPAIDTSYHTLHPSICRICPLCCLSRCPVPRSLALGIAKTPSLINLFVLGLVAGSLSFSGAYTAIPFVQVEAVLKGGWLPQRVFIDCIAIGNVLPAPLVIFATFVGFQGGNTDSGPGNAFAGAVVITLGMFFPCFLFAIAGHSLLEKLVQNKVRTSPAPLTHPT